MNGEIIKYNIMARLANKRTVDNGFGLLNVVAGIDKKDVVSITDFGPFFIVLLKDGAIYHTHIGYEVRCKRWAMDVNNERKETTLYGWLVNLVGLKNGIKGHEEEFFPETDRTNRDMLDSMSLVTEANMLHPVSAFSDVDTAAKFAGERLSYLRAQCAKLEALMSSDLEDESESDLAKNFESGQNAVLAEGSGKILSSLDKGGK